MGNNLVNIKLTLFCCSWINKELSARNFFEYYKLSWFSSIMDNINISVLNVSRYLCIIRYRFCTWILLLLYASFSQINKWNKRKNKSCKCIIVISV